MMRDQELLLIALACLAWLVLCIGWIRWRWTSLRAQLLPPQSTDDAAQAASTSAGRRSVRERFANLVRTSRALLANAGHPETELGASILCKLEEDAPTEAFAAMDNAVKEAIESAEIRSVLVKADDACVYFIVLPNRPEHLRLLNRNATFSGGWLHHVNTLRASLTENGAVPNIVILLCSVNPATLNATLQVTCADASTVMMPSSLAGGKDLTAPGVKAFDGGADFNLAA